MAKNGVLFQPTEDLLRDALDRFGGVSALIPLTYPVVMMTRLDEHVVLGMLPARDIWKLRIVRILRRLDPERELCPFGWGTDGSVTRGHVAICDPATADC